MSYLVKKSFFDLNDNNREYKAGDSYPREGYTPSEERITELTTDSNKLGEPLIMAIKSTPKGIVKPEIQQGSVVKTGDLKVKGEDPVKKSS